MASISIPGFELNDGDTIYLVANRGHGYDFTQLGNLKWEPVCNEDGPIKTGGWPNPPTRNFAFVVKIFGPNSPICLQASDTGKYLGVNDSYGGIYANFDLSAASVLGEFVVTLLRSHTTPTTPYSYIALWQTGRKQYLGPDRGGDPSMIRADRGNIEQDCLFEVRRQL